MKIIKNILAVVLGLVIGSAVNMGIILLGSNLVPPPAGVDVANSESIAASMHLFECKHFLFPFLAHALGAFVGAIVAFLIAASHKTIFAYVVGTIFLVGGIAVAFVIPAPVWFIAVDLIFAYIPMVWIGKSVAENWLSK